MFNFLEKQMKIKRVYFAFMALLLLPVTAMAQGVVVPTPQPGTAVVVVSVFFNGKFWEGGPPTTVTLDCTAASVAPSEVVILDPESLKYEQAFILSQIPGNVPNRCRITSSTMSGYTPEYECNTRAYSGLDGDCEDNYSDDWCQFNDVQIGDQAGCVVNNEVDGVEFEVTKEWDITNAGAAGEFYDFDAEVTIYCDDVVDMEPGHKKSGKSEYRYRQKLKDSDYTDGIAVMTVMVYPEYDGSVCWAEEDDVDSAVEVTNGCEEDVDIEVGSGGACTITNTLFFEGIPTLNQYGMAIMALLMLGVGFVGFRRFV
jgi:hypothetical protein